MTGDVVGDEILPFLHGIIEGMEAEKTMEVADHLPTLLDSTRGFAAMLHMEGQLRMQDQSQAELYQKVDCIAEDVKSLKVYAERERGLNEWLALQDTAISDIRKLHNGLHDRHEARLSDLHLGLLDLRGSLGLHKEEKIDLQAGLEELHLEIAKLQANHEARCDDLERLRSEACERLTGTRQGVADLVDLAQQLERRLSEWRSEIVGDVATEIRSAGPMRRAELLSEEFQHLRQEVRVDAEEFRREVQGRFEEWRALLLDDMRKLRAEIKDALRNEVAVVSSLDEQLWITDQRLGQRIDAVSRSHCECMQLIERRLGIVMRSKGIDAEVSCDEEAAEPDDVCVSFTRNRRAPPSSGSLQTIGK